ncbi:unnamed protein product [Rhizoctonia solani]|uniref:Tail specific protease domain-containing protein n=1 Tax=Rhizoctonia solani TaxID=456999 RepID=A0A8H3G9Y9_9AGAM|nr:unnamed protein product [Rhizoctonia solani]
MPEPYEDVTIDILGELHRIKQSTYSSDFELHQDVSRTIKRLGDGHAGYTNYCYDSLFVTYLPFPLAILAQPGNEAVQNIHIVPEASEIAMKEFGGGALEIWHSALDRNLTDFDGARIISISRQDPWDVVDAYAAVSGGYQSKATRQNNFFSSYQLRGYQMGDFAQSTLPIHGDSISLTLVRNGTTTEETYEVPYLSRKESGTRNFTNAEELWANNCRAARSTNGESFVDRIARTKGKTTAGAELTSPDDPYSTPARFQSDPIMPQVYRGRRLAVSSLVNDGPQLDITLPERLTPTGNVSGTGDMNWFVLEDGKTAVLRLLSFSGSFPDLQQNVLDGIDAVKSKGASRLLIDVTNNGGGIICLASWLHRVLAGPEPGLDFQPGMNGSVRARELPRKIVDAIVNNKTGLSAAELSDSFYSPSAWKDINNKTFPAELDWLDPGFDVQVNGATDIFSQRIGDTCLPFDLDPPATRPFEFENIAIMSNGRCGSSCSLFSILMHLKHKVKTVVVGGKPGTTQQYCGIVGGQSSNFARMDSELKTFGFKNDSFAPPDFLTNSFQGIAWRLAFSPSDPTTFEEFKSHPAQYAFPLLPNTVNNPRGLWNDVSRKLWLE